jgi:hypothetical protein
LKPVVPCAGAGPTGWIGSTRPTDHRVAATRVSRRRQALLVLAPLGADELLREQPDERRSLACVKHLADLELLGRQPAAPLAERRRMLPHDFKTLACAYS